MYHIFYCTTPHTSEPINTKCIIYACFFNTKDRNEYRRIHEERPSVFPKSEVGLPASANTIA